jgi:DNA-directed RNA polymerase subunit RPC12/RpoP
MNKTADPRCVFCSRNFDPHEIYKVKNTRQLVCPRCVATRRQYCDRVETPESHITLKV